MTENGGRVTPGGVCTDIFAGITNGLATMEILRKKSPVVDNTSKLDWNRGCTVRSVVQKRDIDIWFKNVVHVHSITTCIHDEYTNKYQYTLLN